MILFILSFLIFVTIHASSVFYYLNYHCGSIFLHWSSVICLFKRFPKRPACTLALRSRMPTYCAHIACVFQPLSHFSLVEYLTSFVLYFVFCSSNLVFILAHYYFTCSLLSIPFSFPLLQFKGLRKKPSPQSSSVITALAALGMSSLCIYIYICECICTFVCIYVCMHVCVWMGVSRFLPAAQSLIRSSMHDIISNDTAITSLAEFTVSKISPRHIVRFH